MKMPVYTLYRYSRAILQNCPGRFTKLVVSVVEPSSYWRSIVVLVNYGSEMRIGLCAGASRNGLQKKAAPGDLFSLKC
jgi:hypothetical protein